MSTTTRKRGARVYVELDEELTQALDASREITRLTRIDFIRWMLARNLLGTQSLNAIAMEQA